VLTYCHRVVWGTPVRGPILVVVAVVIQAVSNGWLSDQLSGADSLFLSFVAFGASALVFGCVARFRPGRASRGAFRGEQRRLLGLLNVATAVTFLSFYWSLSMVPAPLAVGVESGIGPLALACLRQPAKAPRLPALAVAVVALSLSLAAAARMVSAGQAQGSVAFAAGLGAAALAGVSAATIPVLSFRLGALRVSPVRVNAHRFHLTYGLALVALACCPGAFAQALCGSRALLGAVIAVVGVALPLFVLQVGIQRTQPMTVVLLASAAPGLTYLAAAVAGRQHLDAPALVLINGGLVTAFAGPAVTERLRRPGRARPAPARGPRPDGGEHSPQGRQQFGAVARQRSAAGQGRLQGGDDALALVDQERNAEREEPGADRRAPECVQPRVRDAVVDEPAAARLELKATVRVAADGTVP
jgi:inner membrane transporter RhtA